MVIKNYDITIPKINYQIISLSIMENGQAVKLKENDLMYMTVKTFPENEEVIFQKSLGNGITFNEETMKYEIEILPGDTRDLKLKDYGYDITIYYEGDKPKQKVIGKFTVCEQYTLNEVN